MYLARIKAYDGPCVKMPDGLLGSFTTIKHAGQINSMITVNLRPLNRMALGLSDHKARSMTDPVDNNPDMPDALEVAAKQDAYFKSTGKLVGPLHGTVYAVKDWYNTFDMRTTAGADVAYANDRPPHDATFIKRMRDAGAHHHRQGQRRVRPLAQSRSAASAAIRTTPSDPPGTSSSGSGSSVAANLVTCAIAEETGGSILHPTKNADAVGLAPTQELVSRDGMFDSGYNNRVGPICRTVKDTAKVLDVIAGYDPKDELTVFSVGRHAFVAVRKLHERQASRRHAHRRDPRVHGPQAVQQGRRGKHRGHREGARRSPEARRHDRRSGRRAARCCRSTSTSTRRPS